jgi:hypothetical protein
VIERDEFAGDVVRRAFGRKLAGLELEGFFGGENAV